MRFNVPEEVPAGDEAYKKGMQAIMERFNPQKVLEIGLDKFYSLGALKQFPAGALVNIADSLEKFDYEGKFDYIYIAPPQYKKLWEKALADIDENPSWLKEDGWVIVQIDPVEYAVQTLAHLEEFEQRKYGSTLLVFYQTKIES